LVRFFVVGDVKGEDRKNDHSPCLVDLILIGILSVESINENGYDGDIGVHVVGTQMMFYIVSLIAPGMYIMLEICTVALPKDFTEIRSYVANMEDLFPVLERHKHCFNTSNRDWVNQNSRRMMDSATLKIVTSKWKRPKSAKCNYR
jgi:hypothetical protein